MKRCETCRVGHGHYICQHCNGGIHYEPKTYKIYRWSNGQVVDTFTGKATDCQAYCERYKQYTCEWQEI